MKKVTIAVVSAVCLCSLTVNALLIKARITYQHQTQDTEAYAMESAAAEMGVAQQFLKSHPHYSIAMLAEAGGTLLTLQGVVPPSSKTRTDLFNVGHYLHAQATPTSTQGLAPFVQSASQLLASHISKGRYDVAYLSSDMAGLNALLPPSFR